MPNSPARRALGPTNSLPLLSPGQNEPAAYVGRELGPAKVAQPRIMGKSGTVTGAGGGGGAGLSQRTYGGARSFKRDEAEERMFGVEEPREVTLSTTLKSSPFSASTVTKRLVPTLPPRRIVERDTYSSLRTKWGAESDDELDDSQQSSSQKNGAVDGHSDLKSITQLRARGENTRFVDEFNYLVEGLGSKMAIGIRRAR